MQLWLILTMHLKIKHTLLEHLINSYPNSLNRIQALRALGRPSTTAEVCHVVDHEMHEVG